MRKLFLLLIPIFLGLTAVSQIIPAPILMSLTDPYRLDVDGFLSDFKKLDTNTYCRSYDVFEVGNRFFGIKDTTIKHEDTIYLSQGRITLRTTSSQTSDRYVNMLLDYGFENLSTAPVIEHWSPMSGSFDIDDDGRQYFMHYDMKGYDHSTSISGTAFYGKGISTITIEKGKFVSLPIVKGYMSDSGVYMIPVAGLVSLIDSKQGDTDFVRTILPRKYFRHGPRNAVMGVYASKLKSDGWSNEELLFQTPTKNGRPRFSLSLLEGDKESKEYIAEFRRFGFRKRSTETVKKGDEKVVSVVYKKKHYTIISEATYYDGFETPLMEFKFSKED